MKGGAAFALAGVSGCVGGVGGGDSVELSVTTFAHGEHYFVDAVFDPFEEQVVERAEVDVEFRWYLGDELGPSGEHLQQVRNQSADMLFDPLGYFSDELTVSTLPTLPSPIDSGELGSKVFWGLVNPNDGIIYPKDYEPLGVMPLTAITIDPYQIWTVEERMEEMSDWEGKAMRTLGGAHSQVVSALGGSPVEMPAPDIYSALERGTIDGLTFATTVVPPWDVHEAANYGTTNTSLGLSPDGMLINTEIYNDLPDQLQDVLLEVGEEIVISAGQYVDEETERVREEIADDVELYEASDEFNGAMQTEIEPIVEEEAARLGEEEVIEEMFRLIDEHS